MKGVLALLFLLLYAVTGCKTTRKTTAHPSSPTPSYKSIVASAQADSLSHQPKTTFHQGEELKIYWDLQREGSSCHNCGPVSYEIVRKLSDAVGGRTQMILAPTQTSDWPIT